MTNYEERQKQYGRVRPNQQRQGVMRIGKTRVSTRYAHGAAVACNSGGT